MSEGRHFLEQSVAISRKRKASIAASVVAQALYIISWLAYWQMAANLQYLGWAIYELGQYEEARSLSEESMTIFGTLGQSSFAVDAHIVLASIAHILGEQDRTHKLLQEALAMSREMKSLEDTGRVLCRSGHLFLREGNLETARSLFEESVNLLKASWKIARNKWAMAASPEGLGEIVLIQGQLSWSVQLFAAAEAVKLLAQGMTNAQIAENLTISLSTVDTHIRSIYSKLGVSSRVQAARYSIMHQFLS